MFGKLILKKKKISIAGRQFHYAKCTQLGYMKVTSENGIFPNVVTPQYQYDLCQDIFGEGYDRYKIESAARALEIQYGSRAQQATHVIYTNGLLDSWLDHGITDDVVYGSHVINLQCKCLIKGN